MQEKLLKHSRHCLIDSTFYVVPPNFYQLMVILIYNEDSDLYIPASFILCSHKNLEIYIKILRDLALNIISGTMGVERVTLILKMQK